LTVDASRNETERLLYLDLLKRVLTRTVACERYMRLTDYQRPTKAVYRALLPLIQRILESKGLEIVRRYRVDSSRREIGCDWPPEAETMVGLKRLENVQ
jgi:O-methyltransferase